MAELGEFEGSEAGERGAWGGVMVRAGMAVRMLRPLSLGVAVRCYCTDGRAVAEFDELLRGC
jgi:hypothetical protein